MQLTKSKNTIDRDSMLADPPVEMDCTSDEQSPDCTRKQLVTD